MSGRHHRRPIAVRIATIFVVTASLCGVSVCALAQDATSYLGRGDEFYSRRGQDWRAVQDAIDVWKNASTAFPSDVRFIERLLTAQIYTVKFSTETSRRAQALADGLKLAEQAIKAFPKSAAGYYSRGIFRYETIRQKTAMDLLPDLGAIQEDFQKAKKIDPTIDFGGPDRWLGLIALESPVRRPKNAVESLEAARKLSPNFSTNLVLLAEAYWATGRDEEARALWSSVLAMTASAGFERDLTADQETARRHLAPSPATGTNP